MQKLLNFVNLKEITYSSMENFYRYHNIYVRDDRMVATKQSNRFFSFDHIEEDKFLNEAEKELYLLPSAENEKVLSKLLKASQKEYCDFLDSCISGKPDVDFINGRLHQFSYNSLMLTQVDNFKFAFDIQFSPMNLEQYIDVYSIIYPVWRGQAETFARVKKCKKCESYFYAISLKAEFCQRKCRNAFNYRKNK